MQRSFRGFTLIELLVVIAIIGILSAVVLTSLNTARAKGTDASIKGSLSSARSQAELFYDSNGGSFINVCTNTTVGGVKSIYSMVLSAAEQAGLASFSKNATGSGTVAVCNESASAWAVQVPLKATASTWYCTDSSGYSAIISANHIGSGTDYVCSS